MCSSPITIINRSRTFRPGIDRPYLTVACGKCEECQQAKRNDWFVRAVYEYKRAVKHGFVLFPTLTYRNSDLPVWHDYENDYHIPIFDKSHFVSFRNKLRVYLKRLGYDFTGDNTIRYFYVTEYGGKRGRSHLHVLLFVPKFIPIPIFKSLVKKAWIYGQVRYSPAGDTIQSVKGINYTMKYLHKDMVFYDKYNIEDYLKLLQSKADSDEGIKYKKLLSMFKSYLPHHCQSMGFGSDVDFTDEQLIDGHIKCTELGLLEGKPFYNIPLYYKRKFLYDYDKVHELFRLNNRGVRVKQASFNRLVYQLDKYYSSIIYSNRYIDLKRDFDKYQGYDSFLKMRDYDSRDLALYSLVYRGVNVCKTFHLSSNSDSVDNFLQNMSDNAYFVFSNQVVNKEIPIDDYHNNGACQIADCVKYNDCNIYMMFENALQFIEVAEQQLSQEEDAAKLDAYYKDAIQFGKLFQYVEN